MKVLAVLPVLIPPIADKCIDSIVKQDSSFGVDPKDILLIDNTKNGYLNQHKLRMYRDPDGHNLGVARSWNIAIKEVLKKKLDYVILLSASNIFGFVGPTFFQRLEKLNGAYGVEASLIGWHCIALNRVLFEKVGLFDTNFYPAYVEDIDFGRRCFVSCLSGATPECADKWHKVPVDVENQGWNLHASSIDIPAEPLFSYYKKKWGGDKGEEIFVYPFNGQPMNYFKERSIPEIAKEYKLKTWY